MIYFSEHIVRALPRKPLNTILMTLGSMHDVGLIFLLTMAPFEWLHPKTVRISPYMYERKIREALEINKLKTITEKDKTFTVLNRDNGDYVTTNSWKPLFMKMGNH